MRTEPERHRHDILPRSSGLPNRRSFLGQVAAGLLAVPWVAPGLLAAEEPPLQRPARVGRKTICVVDDVADLTAFYRLILEQRGYSVSTFTDREMALDALRVADVDLDLLITDFLGPKLSAEFLMHQARMAHPGLKILLATGYPGNCLSFCGAKPDRHLRKPFTISALVEAVGDLIGPADYSPMSSDRRL